jgi:hypothetical protein
VNQPETAGPEPATDRDTLRQRIVGAVDRVTEIDPRWCD